MRKSFIAVLFLMIFAMFIGAAWGDTNTIVTGKDTVLVGGSPPTNPLAIMATNTFDYLLSTTATQPAASESGIMKHPGIGAATATVDSIYATLAATKSPGSVPEVTCRDCPSERMLC